VAGRDKSRTLNKKEFWDRTWKEDPDSVRSIDSYRFALINQPLQGSKILEVGCGDLRYSRIPDYSSAPESEGCYTGVDISTIALKRAKEKYGGVKRVHLVQADVTNPLPFQDDFFDEVLSFETITLLGRDFYRALKEMTRVTKHGVTFDVTHRDLARTFASHVSYTDLQYVTLLHEANYSGVAFTEENIDHLLLALGLKPEKIKTFTIFNMVNWEALTPELVEYVPDGDVKYRIYVRANKS